MTPNWMRVLVPREWSADEALLAVSLFRQAASAVWAVHGDAMAAELAEDRYADRLGDFLDDPEDPVRDDMYDIPY